MSSTYRAWTEDDEKALLELKQQGKSAAVIAKILKRTEAAIVSRLTQMKANGIYY